MRIEDRSKQCIAQALSPMEAIAIGNLQFCCAQCIMQNLCRSMARSSKTLQLSRLIFAGECSVVAQEEGSQQGVERDYGAILGFSAEAGHPQHQGDLPAQQPEPASG